jgi:hypothetical protein
MVARARAPLSQVRPLLPSRYEPDVEREAADGTAGLAAGVNRPVARPPQPVLDPPAAPTETSRAARTDAGAHEVARVDGRGRMERRAARVERSDAVGAARVGDAETGIEAERRETRGIRAGADPAASDRAPRTDVGPAPPSAGAAMGNDHLAPADPVRPSAEPEAASAVGRAEPAEMRMDGETGAIEGWSEPARPRDESSAPIWTTPRRDAAEPEARPVHRGATEVSISIGHIEVRAVPLAPPRRKPVARPRVTLDEYLRRRGKTDR